MKGKVSPTTALRQATGSHQKMLTPAQIVGIQSFTETYVKLGTKENEKVAQLLSSILVDDPVSIKNVMVGISLNTSSAEA